MRWLQRIWAWMNWTPTWPVVVAPALPPPSRPLLDCLSIVIEHDPIRF
jgi:hypothetical protein